MATNRLAIRTGRGSSSTPSRPASLRSSCQTVVRPDGSVLCIFTGTVTMMGVKSSVTDAFRRYGVTTIIARLGGRTIVCDVNSTLDDMLLQFNNQSSGRKYPAEFDTVIRVGR